MPEIKNGSEWLERPNSEGFWYWQHKTLWDEVTVTVIFIEFKNGVFSKIGSNILYDFGYFEPEDRFIRVTLPESPQ